MLHVTVRYLAKDDPPPPPTDLVRPVRGDVVEVVGIEAGMQSGLPSVAIVGTLDDGTQVFLETSYVTWQAVSGFLRGKFE